MGIAKGKTNIWNECLIVSGRDSLLREREIKTCTVRGKDGFRIIGGSNSEYNLEIKNMDGLWHLIPKAALDEFSNNIGYGIAYLVNPKKVGTYATLTLVKNHCESTLPVEIKFTYNSNTYDEELEMGVSTSFSVKGIGMRLRIKDLEKHKFLFQYLTEKIERNLMELCSDNGIAFLWSKMQ